MNYKKLMLATGLLLSPLSVSALDVGIGIKGGTSGVGVDFSVAVTDTLNVRLTSTSYDFGEQSESVNINDANTTLNFDAALGADFGAQGILLDWHIFNGTFHLTAGMIKNTSSMGFNGNITDNSVVFDGVTYDVSDFADTSISGVLSFGNSYEPYVGIGWGRKASRDSGLSLSVEIGVMLLDPSVDLTAPTVTVASGLNQADIDADVNASESSANDELGDFEAWPVISVGINYAF